MIVEFGVAWCWLGVAWNLGRRLLNYGRLMYQCIGDDTAGDRLSVCRE